MAQSGSALGWGPSGRRFKSCLPDLHEGPRTSAERRELGKLARSQLSREALGNYSSLDEVRDPVAILHDDDADRVPDLIPIRYGRMLVSPFTFYRGAASIMAHDLAQSPNTGLSAQLCGDAHLSNFGLFASPDRRLVFDINDFDETLPGPWEWDLKRLLASVAIAGRSLGITEEQSAAAVRTAANGYRDRIRELAGETNLSVWYARLEVDRVIEVLEQNKNAEALKTVRHAADKAQTRDSMREFNKLVEVREGRLRIKADPPRIVPIESLLEQYDDNRFDEVEVRLREIINSYKSRLLVDRRHLLDQYEVVHMARKIVGVGSVGTRVWIVLLIGRDVNDPLFLQVKEAGVSVLEQYLGKSRHDYAGQRVIAGQRLMQGATDPLLGWENVVGLDGVERQFYVRQLKDWKGSVTIEKLDANQLANYGGLCGRVLARAHARSGQREAIAAYIGKGEKLADAMVEFATAYADQNDRDYARMREAVDRGEIKVEEGV